MYKHNSAELGCEMKFAVYLPPASETAAVPVRQTESHLQFWQQRWWYSKVALSKQQWLQAKPVPQWLGLGIVVTGHNHSALLPDATFRLLLWVIASTYHRRAPMFVKLPAHRPSAPWDV